MTSGERRQRRRTDKILIALQGLTAVAAAIALGLSLYFQKEAERHDCQVLRAVIYAAATPAHRQQAQAFINSTSLKRC